MGWKGTLRSMQASANRAERNSRRRRRELERQKKEAQKMAELQRAAYEVEVYENYLECLLSIHKDCSPPLDWSFLELKQKPQKPDRLDRHQREVQKKIIKFENNLYCKARKYVQNNLSGFFRSIATAMLNLIGIFAELQMKILQEQLKEAKSKDDLEFNYAIKLYQLQCQALSVDYEKAYDSIIEHINPFEEISGSDHELEMETISRTKIKVTIFVKSEEVIPKESKSLLKSGYLSSKEIPKGKFYGIYQDYICGVVLRIARELFALLPLNMVIVTATGDLLDTQTGHIEPQPILSVAIPRKTLISLDLEHLDPSDCMKNFKHNMNFKKTSGFAKVNEVSID